MKKKTKKKRRNLTQNSNTKFLLEQLIRRDFTKRYKRTALGFAWSILSPLLLYLVMNFVFSYVFSHNTPHYSVFLFSGYVQYQYFNSCTSGVMRTLVTNGSIFSKVNVEKILFVISENVSYVITYFCMLLIYFLFVAMEPLPFTWKFLWLLVPVLYLILLTFAVGLIISVIYVFVRDMRYLWPVVMRILIYGSGIFYNPASFPEKIQWIFWLNPFYLSIYFFRSIVINGTVPGAGVFGLMALALVLFGTIAVLLYQKTKKSMYLYL
jgi:ABC-type polysaccharide/polyol phosphate export permease